MKSNSRMGWKRTVATGFALLFLVIGVWSAVANLTRATGVDFISFWAAGRLVLQGRAADAYNIHIHQLVEQSIHPHVGLIPFPYPPPFLAVVTPFALTTFGIAATIWVAFTAVLYALAAKRVAPLSLAFGNAPTCVNFMIGQTGFLICAIFILGTSVISSAPFAAGAILGLLILKPQLALLLPVATLAGREWRAIAGAILSATAALIAGLLLFGTKAYVGFWNILPHYIEFVRDDRLPGYELASIFGLARFFGVHAAVAIWIHVAIAALATLATARAWWLKLDGRIPILAASTMLISPYFFTYDSLLIVVPIGWMVTNKTNPVLLLFVYACSLIPIITSFSPWIAPNTMPLAAIGSLYALHLEKRVARLPNSDAIDAMPATSS